MTHDEMFVLTSLLKELFDLDPEDEQVQLDFVYKLSARVDEFDHMSMLSTMYTLMGLLCLQYKKAGHTKESFDAIIDSMNLAVLTSQFNEQT